MKKQPRSLSVIITTYNWPAALKQVLNALKAQSIQVPLEVIVADDGSQQPTVDLITEMKASFPYPLHHVWQPDEGFQAAKIRNRALAKAQHEYIIFIDGDCEPLSGFLKNHLKLAASGWFVFGNRILLNKSLSTHNLSTGMVLANQSWHFWVNARLKGQINRLLPRLSLPLGPLRTKHPMRWRGVKTCNLGAWREDLVAVNGLEESFTGWGYEDSDLVLRLQKFGIKCKDGRFAVPVAHYWHAEQDRSAAAENWKRLQQTQDQKAFRAVKGVSQYLVEHGYAVN